MFVKGFANCDELNFTKSRSARFHKKRERPVDASETQFAKLVLIKTFYVKYRLLRRSHANRTRQKAPTRIATMENTVRKPLKFPDDFEVPEGYIMRQWTENELLETSEQDSQPENQANQEPTTSKAKKKKRKSSRQVYHNYEFFQMLCELNGDIERLQNHQRSRNETREASRLPRIEEQLKETRSPMTRSKTLEELKQSLASSSSSTLMSNFSPDKLRNDGNNEAKIALLTKEDLEGNRNSADMTDESRGTKRQISFNGTLPELKRVPEAMDEDPFDSFQSPNAFDDMSDLSISLTESEIGKLNHKAANSTLISAAAANGHSSSTNTITELSLIEKTPLSVKQVKNCGNDELQGKVKPTVERRQRSHKKLFYQKGEKSKMAADLDKFIVISPKNYPQSIVSEDDATKISKFIEAARSSIVNELKQLADQAYSQGDAVKQKDLESKMNFNFINRRRISGMLMIEGDSKRAVNVIKSTIANKNTIQGKIYTTLSIAEAAKLAKPVFRFRARKDAAVNWDILAAALHRYSPGSNVNNWKVLIPPRSNDENAWLVMVDDVFENWIKNAAGSRRVTINVDLNTPIFWNNVDNVFKEMMKLNVSGKWKSLIVITFEIISLQLQVEKTMRWTMRLMKSTLRMKEEKLRRTSATFSVYWIRVTTGTSSMRIICATKNVFNIFLNVILIARLFIGMIFVMNYENDLLATAALNEYQKNGSIKAANALVINHNDFNKTISNQNFEESLWNATKLTHKFFSATGDFFSGDFLRSKGNDNAIYPFNSLNDLLPRSLFHQRYADLKNQSNLLAFDIFRIFSSPEFLRKIFHTELTQEGFRSIKIRVSICPRGKMKKIILETKERRFLSKNNSARPGISVTQKSLSFPSDKDNVCTREYTFNGQHDRPHIIDNG